MFDARCRPDSKASSYDVLLSMRAGLGRAVCANSSGSSPATPKSRAQRCGFVTLFVVLLSGWWTPIALGYSEQSVLWNPGPNYVDGLTLASTPSAQDSCSYWSSSLSEGMQVGSRPSSFNFATGRSCDDGTSFIQPASDGSAPSYYHDTRVGWSTNDLNQYPGWSIWNVQGGSGSPQWFTYLDHALTKPDPCTLREVGLVYQYWPYTPDSHFRVKNNGMPYTLGDFDKVEGRFKAKTPSQAGPPRCAGMPTAYITADFHVRYADASGAVVRDDLVGCSSLSYAW